METFNAAPARSKRIPALWSGKIALRDRAIDHEDIVSDENARLAAYEQVLDHGLCLIANVPVQDGAVVAVAEKFGLVSPTPYADDPAQPRLENIRVDATTLVNTKKSDFLEPHTDTCWRTSLSGLVYMHCLEAHDTGGESILLDGFWVLNRFREEERDAFNLLTNAIIPFKSKVPNGDDWRSQGRLISVDFEGDICGMRYSAGSIDWDRLPAHADHPLRLAIRKLADRLNHETTWMRIQLRPGEMLVIDNHRVLHGRTAFDHAAGNRRIQTCSTRRDEFHNLYRHLARRLGRPDWDHDIAVGVI